MEQDSTFEDSRGVSFVMSRRHDTLQFRMEESFYEGVLLWYTNITKRDGELLHKHFEGSHNGSLVVKHEDQNLSAFLKREYFLWYIDQANREVSL